jgi:hypothetical protein
VVGQARCNTRFTCFASTKVRILTPEESKAAVEDAEAAAVILSLLALLVQKYGY